MVSMCEDGDGVRVVRMVMGLAVSFSSLQHSSSVSRVRDATHTQAELVCFMYKS